MGLKKILAISIIFVVLLVFAIFNIRQNKLVDEQVEFEYELIHEGITRYYYMHIPPQYSPDNPLPLIINLHGGGGSIESARKGTEMEEHADKEGYIVVFPQSHLSKDGSKRWNNGPRIVGPEKESTWDDIGFLRKMINEIESKYEIDKERIYATGISNGGTMTYRIACEMSDRIAAVAVIGASILVQDCKPERPISLLHIHGLADPLVTYDAGPTPEDAPVPQGIRNVGGEFPPVEEAVDIFVQNNGCTDETEITYQNGKAECRTYSNCNEETEVTLCTIEDGGHTWPGGKYEINAPWYKAIVGKISTDISANDVMWKFFQNHPLNLNE